MAIRTGASLVLRKDSNATKNAQQAAFGGTARAGIKRVNG